MKKCATSVAAIGLGLIWMMACGGKSADDGGAAGAQNSAGSSSAGSTSSAGSPGGDSCGLPKVSGPCDAYSPSFWHNPQTGLCEPFIYGGCQGNANRFATREECSATCGGGDEDWGACQHDSDCAITSNSCCDACEPVQDQQLLALNQAYLGKQQNAQCPEPVPCAPCAPVSQVDAAGKYFKPVCVSGQCSVLDVRTSAALTKCGSADDCVLRDGVECCPGCDGKHFVGVNKTANFCDVPQGCDACVAVPSGYMGAECIAGTCTLTTLR